MFTVIGIMFAGIAAGYLLRKIEFLQKIGKPISYTILLLLSFWEYLSVRIRILWITLPHWVVRLSCLPWQVR